MILLSILDHVTIGDIGAVLAFVVSLVTGIKYLQKHLKEWVSDAVKDDLNEIRSNTKEIRTDLDRMKEDRLHDKADSARYKILRFNDELLHNVKHTKEHFEQVLSSVDEYERYCDTHRDTYPNSKAKYAIEGIRRTYDKCIAENNFL